ncbi:MAG TPA: LacI family DNA-binding transcriptional regulator [Capillimicrobium sp.]|nr:LacI family DNA-binding transcriptional regulator [Capillimicrobium sp.]
MTPRVGIRAVAEAAGVSVTTVSHALNGKGRLPDATRRRVQEVARELGYRPNATAQALAGGRSRLLGLAVSQAEDEPFALSDFAYFATLMSAATSAALEHGYALVLVHDDDRGEQIWSQVNVDGAVIVDPIPGNRLLEAVRERELPLVTTGRIPGDEDGYWVDNDHVAGMRSMLDHLARQGAERVALMTTPPKTSYTADALHAYESWCADTGVEPRIAWLDGGLTEGSGYEAATSLLRGDDPPDAIYSSLDRPALGALLAAHALGIAVPDELLVAGCTDSNAGRAAEPALTALGLQPERIGQLAVELLVDLVEGREPARHHLHVPTRVIARGSTRRRQRAAVSPPAAAGAAARRSRPGRRRTPSRP